MPMISCPIWQCELATHTAAINHRALRGSGRCRKGPAVLRVGVDTRTTSEAGQNKREDQSGCDYPRGDRADNEGEEPATANDSV